MFSKDATLRQEEEERLDLSEESQVKLNEYHGALLLQNRIARLDKPSKAAVIACRTVMLGPDGDDAKLGGGAERMFDEQFEDDLMALAPPAANDPLSQFLKDHWLSSKNNGKSRTGSENPRIRYFDAPWLWSQIYAA